MSPPVIKSVKGLPEWFDIEKYQGLDALDIAGWNAQIYPRAYLYSMLNRAGLVIGGKKVLSDGCDQGAVERMTGLIERMFENPIMVLGDFRKDRYVEFLKSRSQECSYITYAVREVNAFRLHGFYDFEKNDADIRDVEINAKSNSANAIQRYGRYGKDSTSLDVVKEPEGTFSNNEVLLKIDMTVTDEQIVSDFRHWLTNFRKAVSSEVPKQNVTERDFKDWVDNGVIPYIDLMLWALVSGCKITQNVLGQAIFTDDINADTTERIRRTTAPKAKHLLDESFARALDIQASLSKVDQK